MYREYTVMQPLQCSYAITEERIQAMVSKGALDSLYNQVKFSDLELMEERDGKVRKQLDKYFVGKPVYDSILADLNLAISDNVWMSPDSFMPHLIEVLSRATTDKKLLEKIADGLSVMDKKAEIQKDGKGNVIYDKEPKDTELVKYEEDIDTHMARPRTGRKGVFRGEPRGQEARHQDRRGDSVHPVFLQIPAACPQRGAGGEVHGTGAFRVGAGGEAVWVRGWYCAKFGCWG